MYTYYTSRIQQTQPKAAQCKGPNKTAISANKRINTFGGSYPASPSDENYFDNAIVLCV
jgi:hypothetical protein